MLTEFSLKNIASYNHIGASFDGLKKINFIYGNNGTGKSTFSRAFDNIDNAAYSECTYQGKFAENRLTYNQDFIEDNFRSDADIPGIFTLGKRDIDKQNQLEELREKINKNETKKEKAKIQMQNSNEEKKQIEQEFINNIWNKKIDETNKMFELYQEAFKGLHSSKRRFYEEYCRRFDLSEYKSDLSEYKSINTEELYEKAEIVFSEEKKELKKVANLDIKSELNAPIFYKSIVGQEDLEFSKLIDQLDMQAWVHAGYKKVQEKDLEHCPFCRSELKEEIINHLSEYFNEKFEREVDELNKEVQNYNDYVKSIIEYLESMKDLESTYIDKETVENIFLKVQAKNAENLKNISQKQSTPSNKFKLNLFDEELEELKEKISSYNEKIIEHNNTVREYEKEKEKVVKDVWGIFLHSTGNIYREFQSKEKRLTKRIKGFEDSIKNKELYISKGNDEICEIEAESLGVTSTVNAINKQLKLYGFRNFSLATTNEKGKYKIIRENGESAKETLSEGEKTFITFLYYYHKVKGDQNKKMLFIDDPISSLDSTVLYIVSTLVKDLIENHENYKIEQLFISTHNTYFFKEITYRVENGGYYIIRKDAEGSSYAKKYDKSPITTSYESLWKELVELKDSSANIIQNVMRRILENYFKIHGGIELNDLLDYFDEDQKLIVSSLIKWTHDGSHHIQEDLYVQQPSEMNDKYFGVFTQIFQESGNSGHLEMMIEKCVTKEDENPFKLFKKAV